MQRIMIIGQPGSGKSTLASALGGITGLPVHHIDRIHWQPGWQMRAQAERARLCHEVETGERWIFEGGFTQSWPHRLARADQLIWLDFPLSVRFFRVFRRSIRDYGTSRPDMQEGCPERISPEFYRWIWDTRHTMREKMRRLYDTAPRNKAKHRLTTRAEVEGFLAEVAQAYETTVGEVSRSDPGATGDAPIVSARIPARDLDRT